MKVVLNKIQNKMKRIPLFINIRNRLLHYKGTDPMKVIIVGLPRSGTSFLTGLVVRMGFDPGPKSSLRAADELNPYGYYENSPLMKIDHQLLKKFNGNVMNPPNLPENWINKCADERLEIKRIVQEEGIEIYKGNMLIILADLYYDLFPNAKWIFISRKPEEIVRSMMDADNLHQHDNDYLFNLTSCWSQSWYKTKASKQCLNIKYEDFFYDSQKTIEQVAKYLEKELSQERLNTCMNFFKPNLK